MIKMRLMDLDKRTSSTVKISNMYSELLLKIITTDSALSILIAESFVLLLINCTLSVGAYFLITKVTLLKQL